MVSSSVFWKIFRKPPNLYLFSPPFHTLLLSIEPKNDFSLLNTENKAQKLLESTKTLLFLFGFFSLVLDFYKVLDRTMSLAMFRGTNQQTSLLIPISADLDNNLENKRKRL